MSTSAPTAASWKHRLANLFGAAGYFFAILLWGFCAIAYLPSILELPYFTEKAAVPAPQPIVDVPTVNLEGNVLAFIFIAITVIVMLGLTFFFVASVPIALVKGSRKTLRRSAQIATDAAIKATHKKPTEKLRRQLQPRVLLAVKGVVLILGVAAGFGLFGLSDLEFPALLGVYVATFFACVAAIFFVLQFALARWLRVPLNLLW